jgi:hypothetical protein
MLLTATLIIAGIALVAAIVVAFRKADKLPAPRAEPRLIRRVGAGNGLHPDEFDDFPPIGGANQARMSRGCKRAPVGWYCTREAFHRGPCAAVPHGRPGTVYTPSVPTTPVATATAPPDVPELSNVILMSQAASDPHAPATDPYAPSHDSGHHSSTDSHCHSSDSGGGFDGGGGND